MLETFTLGRVLVLFESMADYVLLTSPFGGDPEAAGDELAQRRAARDPARPASSRTLGKDEYGAAELFVAHKVAHPAMKRTTLDKLPAADQALLRESGLL